MEALLSYPQKKPQNELRPFNFPIHLLPPKILRQIFNYTFLNFLTPDTTHVLETLPNTSQTQWTTRYLPRGILSLILINRKIYNFYKQRQDSILNSSARFIIPKNCWHYCRLLASLPVLTLVSGTRFCLCKGRARFCGRDDDPLQWGLKEIKKTLSVPCARGKNLGSKELVAMIRLHSKVVQLTKMIDRSYRREIAREFKENWETPRWRFYGYLEHEVPPTNFDVLAKDYYRTFLKRHSVFINLHNFRELWMDGYIKIDDRALRVGSIPGCQQPSLNLQKHISDTCLAITPATKDDYSIPCNGPNDSSPTASTTGNAIGGEALTWTVDLDFILDLCREFDYDLDPTIPMERWRFAESEKLRACQRKAREMFNWYFCDPAIVMAEHWRTRARKLRRHTVLIWPEHLLETETLKKLEEKCVRLYEMNDYEAGL